MSTTTRMSCSCGCDDIHVSVVEATPLTSTEVEEALEHIQNGWTKYEIENESNGSVCSIGALSRARYGAAIVVDFKNTSGIQHLCALDEFVKLAELVEHGIGLHYWNDRPERTQEEVEDAFMMVAKKLRDQGR